MLKANDIKSIIPNTQTTICESFTNQFNKLSAKYGIDTFNRASMFIANGLHETGELIYLRELWGTPHQLLYERDFAQPWNANLKVSDRNYLAHSLGNSEVGDGKKFLGRGIFQYTGRGNYYQLSKDLNFDFVGDPQLLQQMPFAVESAFVFWGKNKLSTYADNSDFDGVADIINIGHKTTRIGDSIGYYQRLNYLEKTKTILAPLYGITA